MQLPAGLSPTILVAAGVGFAVVLVLVLAARALLGGKRDEVIERLERATSGGMDAGWAAPSGSARPSRSRASPGSSSRSRGW